jgi:thiol-disulfide isomerase/thioredoxin
VKQSVLYISVGILALAAGASVAWWQSKAQAATTAATASSAPALWASSFKDVDGKGHPLAAFQGKPLVVNFWATWCEPCKEEIPEFEASSKALAGRANFVGIAIDNAAAVREFTKTIGVSYPILLGEQDALDLAKSEGNRLGVLPFTVIYGKDGKKVLVHVGRLTRDKLDGYLAPLVGKTS